MHQHWLDRDLAHLFRRQRLRIARQLAQYTPPRSVAKDEITVLTTRTAAGVEKYEGVEIPSNLRREQL